MFENLEELTNLCDKVTIDDAEETGLVVEEDERALGNIKSKWRLVGKFLIERSINSQAMYLSTLWRPMKGVFIKDAKPYLFMFQFFHELDMERVVKGESWTFDKHLLLTKFISADEDPMEDELKQTELWVQIFDFLVGLQSKRVLGDVGNFIGEFVELD